MLCQRLKKPETECRAANTAAREAERPEPPLMDMLCDFDEPAVVSGEDAPRERRFDDQPTDVLQLVLDGVPPRTGAALRRILIRRRSRRDQLAEQWIDVGRGIDLGE